MEEDEWEKYEWSIITGDNPEKKNHGKRKDWKVKYDIAL